MRSIPLEALDQAVADGVITAAQRDALVRTARRPEEPSLPSPEAGPGLNPVMVAYSVGAAIVLFAFGWFMVDRWRDLGPPGVLAIAIAFGTVLVIAARMLRTAGFPTAAGWTTVLAVLMAPMAMWALLRLTNLWPAPTTFFANEPTIQSWLWLTLELTTIAAALVALRFNRFPHLALEIAVAAALSVPALAIIVYGSEFGIRYMVEWMLHAVGTGLLAIGYAIHRRGEEKEMSNWFYLVGLTCTSLAWAFGWGDHDSARMALPVVALSALAAAVFLRRRVFFLFGILGVFAWLAYLAFDVFREVASFPVVLATFGISIILLTVLAQRRYPAILALVDSRRGGRSGTLPGDQVTALMPFVIAIVLLFVMPRFERAHARREAAEMRRLNHEAQIHRSREARPAR